MTTEDVSFAHLLHTPSACSTSNPKITKFCPVGSDAALGRGRDKMGENRHSNREI